MIGIDLSSDWVEELGSPVAVCWGVVEFRFGI